MKKLLLLFLAAMLFCGPLLAQTNLSFESWTNDSTPTGWSKPFLDLVNGGIRKETSSPYQGAASVKLTTGLCVSCPSYGFDTIQPGIIRQRIKISGGLKVVDKISAAYKATVNDSDEAMVYVEFTRNTVLVGQAIITVKGPVTQNTWTYNSNVAITWMDSLNKTADTITILLASSSALLYSPPPANQKNKKGSTLWVDSIGISFATGIEEYASLNNISVFPNPSSTCVTFSGLKDGSEFVEISDYSGKIIAKLDIREKTSEIIQLETYPAGTYLYRIFGKENKLLSAGKFTAVK